MNYFSMSKKINASLSLFLLAICLLFSCDKDNVNKKFGQYAVAVSYNGNDFLELHLVIDGKECGKFTPVPNVNPSYLQDCSELKKPDNLTNVFVLKQITPGGHTLEMKTADGKLVKTLAFQMQQKECVFQEINIELN